MPDESPPPPKPASRFNQSLVVGLIFGATLLLLLLLIMYLVRGGFGSSPSPELAELKERVAERRAAINKERLRLGLEPLGAGSPTRSVGAIASRLAEDASTLAEIVGQMQTELARTREELRGATTLYEAATRRNTQLTRQLGKARLSAEDAEALRTQLADTRSLLDASNRRAENLQSRLDQAPDQTALDTVRRQLDSALKERDSLRSQLRTIESSTAGMIAPDEFASLKDRLARLEPENNRLRYELQKLRAELNKTRLFTDKVDSLPAAAKALYVELSKLETADGARLKQEYDRIRRELNATVVDTISFQTGSSQVDLAKVEEISRTVQAAGDKSYFLVVGYASKTGNFDRNKELSKERATTIASVADTAKKDSQGVQAVFLGQTDRFSKSQVTQNQVCEIWEIREL